MTADPIYGGTRTAPRCSSSLGCFRTSACTPRTRSSSESGDWITVVTNVTGTFTGELTLPDGNA